ncbi:MAG: hypothetical protein TQ37_06220 [Candidatus Synechococcus spongiarum 15L]|uniref:Uncharacterized protein n=1 Tax=Candidatus Synechococcus spongiarum 15L TaxID=1608419 RepID=A0A0G8AUV5_9SYNE|nr:MAG: hypothetical protein TQ37_06220 [Candidatus Synechococcus spongiarum 15L]
MQLDLFRFPVVQQWPAWKTAQQTMDALPAAEITVPGQTENGMVLRRRTGSRQRQVQRCVWILSGQDQKAVEVVLASVGVRLNVVEEHPWSVTKPCRQAGPDR